MKDNIITIDGPSASGKGTLARNIADFLGFEILDSGLLYRVYAYLYECGIEHAQITKTINQDIIFKSHERGIVVLKEKNNITDELRRESTAKAASKISALPETRENLLLLQRSFYKQKGLVADGRDMGTVVFPNAKLKIFLNASPEIRAKRRQLDLRNRGQEVNILSLIKDIEQRDSEDKTRKLSPLIQAKDAVLIDSSNLLGDDVFDCVKKLINKLEIKDA